MAAILTADPVSEGDHTVATEKAPPAPSGKPEKQLRGLKMIGSKYRMIKPISECLHGTGAETLVDVFGGSGSVVMNAGFDKNVYNDVDGDLVNFYRVVRDPDKYRALLWQLRCYPMSREEFNALRDDYVGHGNSFAHHTDVERAARTFYRSIYSYGGKFRSGGFSCSTADRRFIKENKTWHSRLRDFARLKAFWTRVCIEHLDFQDCITAYGQRPGVVFYVDPPYYGTENYYTHTITPGHHAFLAEQLSSVPASAVVSYYEFEHDDGGQSELFEGEPGFLKLADMKVLYPESAGWEYRTVDTMKNCMAPGATKEVRMVTEWLLIKQGEK